MSRGRFGDEPRPGGGGSADPPPPLHVEGARSAAEVFRAAGLDEQAAAERVRRPADGDAALPDALVTRRLRDAGDAAGLLLAFFHAGGPESLPAERLRRALGSPGLEALVAAGMAVVDGDDARPTVALSLLGSRRLVSDRMERHRAGAPDFVLGAGAATRRLASFLPDGQVGSVLDLGCGGGALALALADRAERVLATDVSPRAVDFARFNAALNGCGHVECRAGDLFEPAGEERFDLVACNPPFAISPAATFTYRDGGTALCRRIVREAPAHLSPGGTLYMLVEWPQGAGPWQDGVAEWFEGTGCHAWVLRLFEDEPDAYAWRWTVQEAGGPPPSGLVDRWVENLEAGGVRSVGGGLVVLRPAAGGAPLLEIGDAPPMAADGVGGALVRWLDASRLAAELAGTRAVLDRALAPAPGLVRTDERTAREGGWTGASITLRSRDGLRFGATVDPVAAEVVARLGPAGRTPREALRDLAAEHGVSPERFLEHLPDALLSLLRLGLVVPAGG